MHFRFAHILFFDFVLVKVNAKVCAQKINKYAENTVTWLPICFWAIAALRRLQYEVISFFQQCGLILSHSSRQNDFSSPESPADGFLKSLLNSAQLPSA